MRFENEGLSLWYGTADAPGPGATAPAGTQISITVGVQPADASNQVDALYRVNRGPVQTVPARWLRHDPLRKAQYFTARLPAFQDGDVVEYRAVCRCAGRQVPPPGEADGFAASFTIAAAMPQPNLAPGSGSVPRPNIRLQAREVIAPGTLARGAKADTAALLGTSPALGDPQLQGGFVGQGSSAGQPVHTKTDNPISAQPDTGGSNGAGAGPPTARRVSGQAVSEDGGIAVGVVLRLYYRGFGGKDTNLGQVTTDSQGAYSLSYQFAGTANIQLRAVDAQGKEVSLSQTRFAAQDHEELNVVIPRGIVRRAVELVQLRADLTKQVPDQKALAGAVESGERLDFSTLSAATGWDARLVSLAALAEKQSTETGLSSDVLYGAFRAGLPTDKNLLAVLGGETFGRALDAARNAGVISLDDTQLGNAKQAYDVFARALRRGLRAPGALSTIGDLLGDSGLSDKEKNDFEDLFFARRSRRDDLWTAARAIGLSEAKVSGLRLQGKLAALTLNNAALVASLRAELPSPDKLGALVEKGLYEAAAWKKRLSQLASATPGGLDQLVPPGYVGNTTDKRLDVYAEDLARKVRQSFPTKVIGQRVANDELILGDEHQRVKPHVARILKNAEDKGIELELGKTPLGVAFRDNRDVLFEGVPASERPGAEKALKLMQRLYQVTPSDHAMGVLLSLGFRSAGEIAALRPEDFQRRFGDQFRPGEAQLLHSKCSQVTHVVFNSFIHAQQVMNPSGVAVLSSSPAKEKQAQQSVRNHFPTLENLFGSLDYCECEDCRSVLSPAAYLVDLLQYLDPADADWGTVLSKWKTTNGTNYPFAKPYDVLINRRPDLPEVALTCENTNTSLPYIDVVNEVLEYYVGHGKLEAAAARDTGDVTSEDLIAEPKYMTEQAYSKLAAALYPLTLPFDLWSETVRRFLEHFDTRYAELLEIFRRSDVLFSTDADPQSFGWSAVFLEQLELSPGEAAPLSDPALIENRWWELYGYASNGSGTPENTALAELSKAKTLSRRLGVTYKELVELVRAWFVNPELDALAALRKLGLYIEDILRLKGQAGYRAFSSEEQAAFDAKVAAGKSKYGFDAATWIDKRWESGDFGNVVVLADTTGNCDFDETVLRFADGRSIDKATLVRINLLVRLWRKLGWNLGDLDQALRVFTPSSRPGTTLKNIAASMKTVLIYLAHLASLDARMKVGKYSRQRLLTFWGPLATRAKDSLYARLFLTPSVLNNDAVFDNPLGDYLIQAGLLLKDHLPAIQGAIGLSAADIELLIGELGPAPDASLSLDTVTYLLHHAVLAKGLKVSIADLLYLKRLSGIDPFEALATNPLSVLADDRPFTRTIRFVEFVETVRRAGLKIADAVYLMSHEFDPVGPHRERPDLVLALIRDLGQRLDRIAAAYAVPADPIAFTDELLRQTLSLIAPAGVVDTFFGMWKRSPAPADAGGDAAVVQIPFDPQKAQAFLDTQFPGLFEANDAALFDPTKPEADRRQRVAAVLLPYVQSRETRQEISDAVATRLGAEAGLVSALLTDPSILHDPGTASDVPLIESYLSIIERGLTVTYFASTDGSGPALQAPTVIAEPAVPAPPAQAKSALVEGYVEVPQAGTFRFLMMTDGVGTDVMLQVGATATPALLGKVTAQGQELAGDAELRPGALLPFRCEVHALAGGFTLSVQGPSLALGPVGRLPLRPRSVFERLRRADLLLSKAVALAGGLSLTEREVRYVAAHPDDFEGFSFAQLPLEPQEGPAASGAASGGDQLLKLAEYVICRTALNVEGDEMAALLDGMSRILSTAPDLEQAKQALFSDACEALGQALRRPPSAVRRVAEHLGYSIASSPAGAGVRLRAEELTEPTTLRRMLRGLEVAVRIGVSVDTLLGSGAAGKPAWAQPVPPPDVQSDLGSDIACGVRDGVRALYDDEAWRLVVQPISDKLRRRKRDALVAYIMFTEGFESVNEMFEYFLVDPGMEPVVWTSRIQLAISSVQTFIQRCFLNLESEPSTDSPPMAVPPLALDSDHWQWMKRYRVWEANRKIFLFPENWLEPEFRDDKSYLFEELEGTLLQGDVSDELVENAFLKYLKGLDQIARLEIVSSSADEERGTLHVLGRTYELPQKYFYRKNVWGNWFPWEPVTADIQGDHIVPVVWRKRLHLFWVTFLPKGQAPDGQLDKTPEALRTEPLSKSVSHGIEVQLHWVEKVDGKWVGRGSSPSIDLGVQRPTKVDLKKVTIHATTSAPGAGPAVIHLGGEIGQGLRLASKNGLPTLVPAVPPSRIAFYAPAAGPTFRRGWGALKVKDLAAHQEAEYGNDVRVTLEDVTVLGGDEDGRGFEIVPIAHHVLSSAVGGDTQHLSLYRLYKPSVDHFYTTSEAERDSYMSLHGYADQGIACRVLPVGDPDGVPLYRLHNPATGDHLYTTSASEREDAQTKHGYLDEGIACHVPAAGPGDAVPLYRARHGGDHFYTTSLEEKDNFVSSGGFIDEGIACNVFPPEISAEEVRRLTDPVFYRDSQYTFFVDPSLEETRFERWEDWVVPVPLPEPGPWQPVSIVPQVPRWMLAQPSLQVAISQDARFKAATVNDWLVNDETIFLVGDRAVGGQGSMSRQDLVAAGSAAAVLKTVAASQPGARLESIAGSISIVGSGGALSIVGQGMSRYILAAAQ